MDKDIWLHRASQPGKEQNVSAVVSETFVLRQMQETVQLRETWLRDNGLPLDFQMRDGLERPRFNKWAREQWEQTPEQIQKRQQDAANNENVHQRSKSRWTLEMQRRLGTHQLWYMVLVYFYGSRTCKHQVTP